MWESEKLYPGGKVTLVPLPHCEKYEVIYTSPEGHIFHRGYKTLYEINEETSKRNPTRI
jgi:hypothetical protein